MKAALSCAVALLVAAGPLAAAAPPAGADPARVKALLRKLDADSFFTRQRADRALRAMGRSVLPLLRAERERTRSFEVRDRLDRMMRDLALAEEVAHLVQLLLYAGKPRRDLADTALRRGGASVVPLLKNALNGELDAPRRARLEKIIADLSAPRR